MSGHPEALVDWTRRHYEAKLAEVVRSLRAMADRVEREGIPNAGPDPAGTPRYAGAAVRVQHTIAWDLANTGAHYLTSAASLADQAERDADAEAGR